MPNTYHDQMTGSDLHENKINATTQTELTPGSLTRLDSRWAAKATTDAHITSTTNPHATTAAQVGAPPVSRSINTTAPLSGGGNLSADRTLALPAATNSQDGYLTAADHAAFAAKQPALGYTAANKAGDTFTASVIVDVPGAGNTLVTRVGGAQRTVFSSAGGTDAIDAGSSNLVLNGASLLLQAGGSERARIAPSGFLGIGVTSPHTKLHVNGPLAVAIITKTAAYTITATDSVILADATSAAFTLTLPTAVGVAGRYYTVKKVDGTANAIGLATTASQTIDNSPTRGITIPYDALTVISDGSNWFLI